LRLAREAETAAEKKDAAEREALANGLPRTHTKGGTNVDTILGKIVVDVGLLTLVALDIEHDARFVRGRVLVVDRPRVGGPRPRNAQPAVHSG
jgi:hypothetical protein